MATAFTRRRNLFQQYSEALHDSESLQRLAGDSGGNLQRKHYELQRTPKIEDDTTIVEITALQNIVRYDRSPAL